MTTNLSPLLQPFFTERLMSQRQASPHTIASYRDTFRLLLAFAEEHLNKPPSKLTSMPRRAQRRMKMEFRSQESESRMRNGEISHPPTDS